MTDYNKQEDNLTNMPGPANTLTPAQLCRQTAIEYIGLGGKSSGKVRQKLESHGFDHEIITACIAKLREDDYINDGTLASRIIRDRRGRRAESHLALIQRMQNQGIPVQAAETAVYNEALSDYELLLEYLQERGSKELAEMSVYEPYSPEFQSLLGRLGRRAEGRGFSAGMIRRAVQELIT